MPLNTQTLDAISIEHAKAKGAYTALLADDDVSREAKLIAAAIVMASARVVEVIAANQSP